MARRPRRLGVLDALDGEGRMRRKMTYRLEALEVGEGNRNPLAQYTDEELGARIIKDLQGAMLPHELLSFCERLLERTGYELRRRA
jgi:hypothetical protein